MNIDLEAPVTVASGVDAKWHRRAVTLALQANDVGPSGVRSVSYHIDKGAWKTATKLTVPAPANHHFDGTHTVYFRATDNAGNVELTKSCKVRIDTTGPTCTASTAARAVTGTKVALRYRVADAHSTRARVTIRIKNAAGHCENLAWVAGPPLTT